VILFRRNIDTMEQVAALCAQIHACRTDLVRAVDQEGGRVKRLGPPCLAVPAAAVLAKGGSALCEEVGEAVGAELAALGFTLDFAPVLDVHSNDANPIIGDRAFGRTPADVVTMAGAFARGLQRHVDACGKHYPGHGDTDKDSHLELPVVSRDEASLRALELAPFAAAHRELPALMSAHVHYPAWDDQPATLSKKIATDILRGELGFEGVLVSDDLEMKALPGRPEDHAVPAIAAGCDVLLVCSDEAAALASFDNLRQEIERSPTFRARAEQASARMRRLRTRHNAPDLGRFAELVAQHRDLQARLA
jgi:beta-N-acetylhexosaminidase